MSILKDIASLIERFGKWVNTLFDNSEKLYKLLTDTEKEAANYAYGVIAILNKYADDIPLALETIGIKYPGLSPEVLHGFLDLVLSKTKTVVDETPLTLEEAATALANHLSTLEGETWQQVSQAFGNLLAILFSPTTPIQKFIAAAEYAYRAIVKPHIED